MARDYRTGRPRCTICRKHIQPGEPRWLTVTITGDDEYEHHTCHQEATNANNR